MSVTAPESPPSGHPPWYRLDNAGKLYPSVTSRRLTTLFRLAVRLTEPVHADHAQAALEAILPRFPYYAVQLRPGAFWHYFDHNPAVPELVPDSRYPCHEFRYKRRGNFPFRVRAFHRCLAVEFSHALTDGTGALAFLRGLLAEYLRRRYGVEPEGEHDLMLPGQEPDPGEFEDAFARIYRRDIPRPREQEKAFQLPQPLEHRGVYHIVTGLISAREALARSRELGVSLGELLIAAYLDAFQQAWKALPPRLRQRHAGPVRLDIPVDLRRRFGSKTMRNFFLPVHPEIDLRLGEYAFDEILHRVHHFMRIEVDQKYLAKQIARNVAGERNLLNRIVPLPLKNAVLSYVYHRLAQRRTSSGVSNLGRTTMPAPLDRYVERFEFIPPPPTTRKVACGVVSYEDVLTICIGRSIEDPAIARPFFRRLVQQGLHVRIESN